jgi:hypothetical protein
MLLQAQRFLQRKIEWVNDIACIRFRTWIPRPAPSVRFNIVDSIEGSYNLEWLPSAIWLSDITCC